MKSKEVAVSLEPILLAARYSENQDSFEKSSAGKKFIAKHITHTEGATNLCKNIYENKTYLAKVKTEVTHPRDIHTI